jgi:DNA-binding NtrC family response regulator
LNLDGAEREYEISAFPLKDEDDRVVYGVEVARDVTPLSRGVSLQRKLGKLFTQELALSFVYDQIGLWAPDKGPVLIVGGRGTGKKLVARALHQLSGRTGLFTPYQCLEGSVEEGAGVAPGLPGAWEKAIRGTLYLDEAACLAPEAQRDLVKRVTSSSQEESPRLIAGTRGNLSDALQKGTLTPEFVNLFAGHVLQLPPLRERRRDLPVLAQHFIEAARSRHGCAAERLGPDALRELLTYDWPGNVLELETRLEGACLLSEGPVIEKLLLPVGEEKVEKLDNLLDRAERSCLSDALTRSRGRLDLTAELTGLSPKTLQRKLKKHSLHPKDFRRTVVV